MADYTLNYTGSQVDTAIGKALKLPGDSGVASGRLLKCNNNSGDIAFSTQLTETSVYNAVVKASKLPALTSGDSGKYLVAKYSGGAASIETRALGTATTTTAGLLPALPSSDSTSKYLRGDGTWDNDTVTLTLTRSGTYTQLSQDFITTLYDAVQANKIVHCRVSSSGTTEMYTLNSVKILSNSFSAIFYAVSDAYTIQEIRADFTIGYSTGHAYFVQHGGIELECEPDTTNFSTIKAALLNHRPCKIHDTTNGRVYEATTWSNSSITFSCLGVGYYYTYTVTNNNVWTGPASHTI